MAIVYLFQHPNLNGFYLLNLNGSCILNSNMYILLILLNCMPKCFHIAEKL